MEKTPLLLPLQVFAEKKSRLAHIRMWFELTTSQFVMSNGIPEGVDRRFVEYRQYGYEVMPLSERSLSVARENLRDIRAKCDSLRDFLDKAFTVEELL
jgi:hypothetical protein